MQRLFLQWLVGVVLAALLLPSTAVGQGQTGGQFCLRAYEDRNGSATLDPGEPFLTRGVSVNLLNAENLVVASALMDDSPNAAQGVICFQFLEAGQYSLVVTSAEYQPTTSDTFTASISEGTLPTVIEYGARRIAFEPTPNAVVSSAESQRDSLARIVLAALGALVVIAAMIVLGAFIYLLAFRRQPQRLTTPPPPLPPDYRKTPPTGSIPPVKVDDDTGEIEKVNKT